MNLDELGKKFEDGIALQPLWNEDDYLPLDEKSKVYAVMRPMHLSLSTLKYAYEVLCDEYRRRLCEMWNLHIEDSWWVPSDRPGGVLILSMCDYSISMEDARLFVDLNIGYDNFMEWCDYNMEEYNHDRNTINSYSWFVLGARPEMLKGQ